MPARAPAVWASRLLPLAGLILVILAMFFSRNQTLRSMSLGGAAGILIGIAIFASQVAPSDPDRAPRQPSGTGR